MWSSSKASVLSSRQARGVASWELAEFPELPPLQLEVAAEPEEDPAAEALRLAAEEEAARVAEAARLAAEREAEAAAERDALRAQAYAEGLQAGIEQGHATGYHEGYEAGRLEGERAEGMRLASVVQAAERAVDDLRDGEEKWVGTIEENICALATAIARQLVGQELREHPLGVAELVHRALAEFPIDQPIRIRINPSDLVALSSVTAPIVGTREASWIADAQIAPGGCLVEGRDRIIDGRVDSALERVYRRLTHKHA